MTPEEHKKRHIILHKMFDELLADFFTHFKRPNKSIRFTDHKIMDLMAWSHQQTQNPDPDYEE